MSYLTDTFSLGDRRAVVTGASRGIGRAIALALAAAGAEVVVHYHSSADAAGAVVDEIHAKGGTAHAARGDLSDASGVDSLFADVARRWGGELDILVNNAGDMAGRWPIESYPLDAVEQLLRLNLTGTILCCRAAAPLLRRGTGAAIVNLTSVAAHSGGGGGVSVYAATKGGILTLTRSLAKELAPQVRVNAIAPGIIVTDLHTRLSSDERMKQFAAATPLGRNGTPDECAAAVVFLCSPGAAFITGETIEINGGIWFA